MRKIGFFIITSLHIVIGLAQQNREQYMIDSLMKIMQQKHQQSSLETPQISGAATTIPQDYGILNANTNKINLTEEDRASFKLQADELVNRLQLALAKIVDVTYEDYVRKKQIKEALSLFTSDSCIIEITGVKNQNEVIKRKIKTYLNNLFALANKNYQQMAIQFTNVYALSDPIPHLEVDENDNPLYDEDGNQKVTYSATVVFCQETKISYKGKSLENMIQWDKVQQDCKRAKIVIKRIQMGGKYKWVALIDAIVIEDKSYHL